MRCHQTDSSSQVVTDFGAWRCSGDVGGKQLDQVSLALQEWERTNKVATESLVPESLGPRPTKRVRDKLCVWGSHFAVVLLDVIDGLGIGD